MALVVTIMLALILGLAGATLEGNKYMIGLGVAVFAIMTLVGLSAAGLITQDQLQSAILLPLILGGALIGVIVYVLQSQPATNTTPATPAPQTPPRTPQAAEPAQISPEEFQDLLEEARRRRGGAQQRTT